MAGFSVFVGFSAIAGVFAVDCFLAVAGYFTVDDVLFCGCCPYLLKYKTFFAVLNSLLN